MPEWLKKVFYKFNDPQISLQIAYDSLQREIVETRQELDRSIAKEKSLQKQLAMKSISPKQTARLETELIRQRTLSDGLRQRLKVVECEIQKAYTKRQLLIAQKKASEAFSGLDPSRPVLVIIAIMTVWAFIGVFLQLRSQL